MAEHPTPEECDARLRRADALSARSRSVPDAIRATGLRGRARVGASSSPRVQPRDVARDATAIEPSTTLTRRGAMD